MIYPPSEPAAPSQPRGSAAEVFGIFLRLGLTSFGGPIAHLGYMRNEFVGRRKWLDEHQFGQLLAICQFLPGPASSQLGFAIGMARSGWSGGLAAFIAFTLPSALLMLIASALTTRLDAAWGRSLIHGLKLVAVVVVAHGLWGMFRQLAPDTARRGIAAIAACLMLFVGTGLGQIAVIGLGGAAGIVFCRNSNALESSELPFRYGYKATIACICLFLFGLGWALTVPTDGDPTLAGMTAAFYRAGTLVFGGGHVVLPLLKESLVDPGWITTDHFLAGYGFAQALPGPMFSLAAYLGADMQLGDATWLQAVIALIAVFTPGFLLLVAAIPVWNGWIRKPWTSGVVAGVNASVVGLLAAAFYDPVLAQGITDLFDMLIALVCFLLLRFGNASNLVVVAICVAAALVAGLITG